MRFFVPLVLAALLTACAAAPPPVPTSDEARAAEAAQLVRFSLTERIMDNLQTHYSNQLGPVLAEKKVPADVAGKVVSEEMADMIGAEHQRLIDALVPIYRRYYTPEEIHELLSFYQTDVARKSMKISGQIAAEGSPSVRLWSEHFGDRLMERVEQRLEAEGYELGE